MIASGLRGQQRFDTDVLVVARLVGFVELVAPAELGADGIPQQLQQSDLVDGFLAVGAAHEAVEIGA